MVSGVIKMTLTDEVAKWDLRGSGETEESMNTMIERGLKWLQEKAQWYFGKPREKNDCSYSEDNSRTCEADSHFAMSSPLIEAINTFRDELRTQYEESQAHQRKNTLWVKAGTVAVIVYTILTGLQLRSMYSSLQAQQRAAVFVGNIEGRIGEVTGDETSPKVFLYIRNYGQSAARRTIIETWPFVISKNESLRLPIQPRRKLSSIDTGPIIPPGGTWRVSVRTYDQRFTISELNKREKQLWVVVRILYEDTFGEYCESAWLAYIGPAEGSQPDFSLPTWPIADLCGGDEAAFTFSASEGTGEVSGVIKIERQRRAVDEWIDDWRNPK